MNEYVQEVGLTILEIAARYHGRRFLEFLQLLSGQNAVVIIWTGLRGTIMSDFKVFFFSCSQDHRNRCRLYDDASRVADIRLILVMSSRTDN